MSDLLIDPKLCVAVEVSRHNIGTDYTLIRVELIASMSKALKTNRVFGATVGHFNTSFPNHVHFPEYMVLVFELMFHV